MIFSLTYLLLVTNLFLSLVTASPISTDILDVRTIDDGRCPCPAGRQSHLLSSAS